MNTKLTIERGVIPAALNDYAQKIASKPGFPLGYDYCVKSVKNSLFVVSAQDEKGKYTGFATIDMDQNRRLEVNVLLSSRRGTGTTLMNFTKRLANFSGAKEITLTSLTSNKNFYRTNHFKSIKIRESSRMTRKTDYYGRSDSSAKHRWHNLETIAERDDYEDIKDDFLKEVQSYSPDMKRTESPKSIQSDRNRSLQRWRSNSVSSETRKKRRVTDLEVQHRARRKKRRTAERQMEYRAYAEALKTRWDNYLKFD